jgi:hypothetical protein
MREGRVHPDAIAELVATLERARAACAARHVTLVGEIAAVLCRCGKTEAALELERLWDEGTRSLPIFTICAYPGGCLDQHGNPELMSHISARHAVISQEPGFGS